MLGWIFLTLTAGFVLLNDHEKIWMPFSRLSEIEQQFQDPSRDIGIKNETLSYRFETSGNDERVFIYNDTEFLEEMEEKNRDLLIGIQKNMDQLELLKILENPGIGISFKIAHLEHYELTHGNGLSMAINLTAGGLFDDFNYESAVSTGNTE
jgi:hypothetical protein